MTPQAQPRCVGHLTLSNPHQSSSASIRFGVVACIVVLLVSYAPAINPVLSLSQHPCHYAVQR
jgi:hypothetical protein